MEVNKTLIHKTAFLYLSFKNSSFVPVVNVIATSANPHKGTPSGLTAHTPANIQRIDGGKQIGLFIHLFIHLEGISYTTQGTICTPLQLASHYSANVYIPVHDQT